MDFEHGPDLLIFQQKARAFIRQYMAPEIDEYDRKSVFPRETFKKFGAQGFLGASVPKDFGGQGLGTPGYCLLCEELGRLGAGAIHNGIFQTQKMILVCGSEELKQIYLPGLCSGDIHAATAISEPDMGSSFAMMTTSAGRDGAFYVLNGEKTHINDAAEADLINVFAKTDAGLSVFLVEKGTAGFFVTQKLDPMGLRSSPIYAVKFSECRIPETRLVGTEGGGLAVFTTTFNFSRLGNASTFIGMAREALERAVEFAKQRKIGSSYVADFQGIRWIVADLHTKLEAAVLLRDKAAYTEEAGRDVSNLSSMAKYYAGEMATEAVMSAIRVMGSHGCYRDSPFERLLRDVKALEIAGGTPEIMKNVIASSILGRVHRS
ncbi:MAG: acyl-CoA/acyl-ACP dehydrogenase [Deltaproteobacteria bacterium]|nr:acyl-CoA/acyl-ACP dehydrogenase [Deltaproteobacteria bacterium]